MARHRCPYCRCGKAPTRDDLVAWVNDGVKAEGEDWFCEPRCSACAVEQDGRCPRDPFCKRYAKIAEVQP